MQRVQSLHAVRQHVQRAEVRLLGAQHFELGLLQSALGRVESVCGDSRCQGSCRLACSELVLGHALTEQPAPLNLLRLAPQSPPAAAVRGGRCHRDVQDVGGISNALGPAIPPDLRGAWPVRVYLVTQEVLNKFIIISLVYGMAKYLL